MPPTPSSLRNLRIGTDICSIQRIFNILTGRLGKQFADKILVKEERQIGSSKLEPLTRWKDYLGRVNETEKWKRSWEMGQRGNMGLVEGEVVEVKRTAKDFELMEKKFSEEEKELRSELMRTAEFLAGRWASALYFPYDLRKIVLTLWGSDLRQKKQQSKNIRHGNSHSRIFG